MMNLQDVFDKTIHDFAKDLANKTNVSVFKFDDDEFNDLIEQNKLTITYIHKLLENYHYALLEELGK